jgi:MFS superfamily sulfate permease-like transporter
MAGRRADFLAAPAAMLGVLVFDALPGLFIGTAVSMLLLLYRAFRRHIARLAAAPTPARGSTSTATPI